ncbi:MAG TPA: hypothetical protein VKS78_18590, partial [Roseiarcus sp.]|nr:hypothetical protein [Roseiarcus sp.]
MRRFVTGPYAPASLLAVVVLLGAATSLYEKGPRPLPVLARAKPAIPPAQTADEHASLTGPMLALAAAMSGGARDAEPDWLGEHAALFGPERALAAAMSSAAMAGDTAPGWLANTPLGGADLMLSTASPPQGGEQIAALPPMLPAIPPQISFGGDVALADASPTRSLAAAVSTAPSNETAADELLRNAAPASDATPLLASPPLEASGETRLAALEPIAPAPSAVDQSAPLADAFALPSWALDAAASAASLSSDMVRALLTPAALGEDDRPLARPPSQDASPAR